MSDISRAEYEPKAPQREEAKRRGCTCSWWGTGAIIVFDSSCPIAGEHRRVAAARRPAPDYLAEPPTWCCPRPDCGEQSAQRSWCSTHGVPMVSGHELD